MAFEKLTVGRVYHPLKEAKPGDVLVEGLYIRKGVDSFGGNTFEFKGDSPEIHVLNSAGHLNWLMSEYCSIGDYCRITYKGTEKLKKGMFKGKDSHTFDLEVDRERSIRTVEDLPQVDEVDDAQSVNDVPVNKVL